MPPKVKFRKDEIVDAATAIVRESGPDALTAREIAAKLGVSTRPIFTYFDSMDALRREVAAAAVARYRAAIKEGLSEPIPFLGVWKRYIRFAKEEPGLYRLLFFTESGESVKETLRLSQETARESIMRIYRMDAASADKFFRNIWLVAFSFATLIVTGECPYSDEEIFAIGSEISLSICKAYKEIPGLAEGTCDKDAVFSELTGTPPPVRKMRKEDRI